jgi:DNA-binding NarL/FixJ family response regulator
VTVGLPLAPPKVPSTQPPTALKPRELEVLEQLARGQRNRQIAEHLHISEHTVKFHVANILDKLNVSSRGEAAAIARSMGLDPVA